MWLHLVTFGLPGSILHNVTPPSSGNLEFVVDAQAALAKVYSGVMDPVPGHSGKKTTYIAYIGMLYIIYICTNIYIHRYLLHSTYSTTSICNMKYQCYTDMNDVCIM